MLQYLINATAIWLLSLVIFDLFLRRESYHSYNRFYLLTTFALGLALPIWEWQDTTIQYATRIGEPVMEQASTIKNNIVNSNAANSMLSIETILWIVYFAGMGVAAVLLAREVVHLVVTYRRSNKFKDGVWTIAETGRQHAPYSAFRYVFISNTEDYTEEQLRIILNHEEQHGHLLHFFDLLFLQIGKIIFWFHPLVYMYADRLSIVHEYQADAAAVNNPKEYGQFLIEQSILNTAPALSHSFNRSPIKKRIVMLTRNSSSISKSKMLLVLPLTLVCVLCFTKDAFSDDKSIKDGKITYRGNVISMEVILPNTHPDTVTVIDPVTGEEKIMISVRNDTFYVPKLLNNEKIYNSIDIETWAGAGTRSYKPHVTMNELYTYLLENIKPEITKLKDGDYYLTLYSVIVDKTGKIAYFNGEDIRPATYNKTTVAAALQKAVTKKMASLLHSMPKREPAAANGKHVPYIMDGDNYIMFAVNNGKVTEIK